MSSDLFAADLAAKLDRLRALGWKFVEVYGTWRWEKPETREWFTESEALDWLGKKEKA